MGVSRCWFGSFRLLGLDPLHEMNIQDRYIVVDLLHLEVLGPNVPSEEYHHVLEQHAGVLLPLKWWLSPDPGLRRQGIS